MLPASAMGGILENDPPSLQLVANVIGQRPVFLSPGFFTPGYHSAQLFIQRDGLSDLQDLKKLVHLAEIIKELL